MFDLNKDNGTANKATVVKYDSVHKKRGAKCGTKQPKHNDLNLISFATPN